MASKTPLYDRYNKHIMGLVDGKSKILTTSKGLNYLVDIDFEPISVVVREREDYLECNYKTRFETTSLGRYLLKITDPLLECDHINRNSLDNRLVNLRIVPKRVNLHNRKFVNGRKYRGVSKQRNGHRIEICSFSRVYRLYLGAAYSEEQCGKIFDCIALKLNGDVQITNFNRSEYTEIDINKTYDDFSSRIKLCPVQPSKQKSVNKLKI